jgi:hypothetical protein
MNQNRTDLFYHVQPQDHPEFKDVSSTAMDIQRFIQVICGIMRHTALHMYVSALPFSPDGSRIVTGSLG